MISKNKPLKKLSLLNDKRKLLNHYLFSFFIHDYASSFFGYPATLLSNENPVITHLR